VAESSLQLLTKSPLNQRQKVAAIRCAEDLMTDEEIAAEAGVSRQSLYNWRQRDDFQDAIKAADAAILQKALRLPIARKHYRVKTLNDQHAKALAVIDERAAEMAGVVAGGGTGLLVRQYKQIGTGRDAQTVEEFAVDTALMREIRATEEQAAREVGDWQDNNAIISGTIGVRLIGVNPGDV
jgi:transcriptional regulator with XRE-family HTH domain